MQATARLIHPAIAKGDGLHGDYGSLRGALLTLLWVTVDVTLGNCSWSSGEWWAESAAGEVGHGDQ
jgi:hypothetical protein